MERLGGLLASILLVVVLPGCGQHPVPTASPQHPTLTASPSSATPTSDVTAASVGLNVVATDGLAATSPKGHLRCPLWYDRRDEIVLGSDRLALSDDQAAQLKRQWTAYRREQTSAMPDALRQVPGAPTAAPMRRPPVFNEEGGTNYFWGPGCALELQITDIGPSPVVVATAGLRLTGASTGNPNHYNLVDLCSLDGTPPENCHPEFGGGPTYCGIYSAQVQMTPGAAGATYRDSPMSTDQHGPCPAMTISRGVTKELSIQAVSAQPQIYSVVPELVVQTAQGTSTVSLPELAATVAFAVPSQFSCYKLAGASLVKTLDGPTIFPAPDPQSGLGDIRAGKWPTGGVWCV